MSEYPENLLKTVAANLLKKQNGEKNSIPLTKVAADAMIAPQERRNQFLQEYKLNPDDFADDREANKLVDGRVDAAQKQIKDYYNDSRKKGLGSPELDAAEQKMLETIKKQSEGAASRFSINRTMAAAEKDPDQFRNFQSLSQDSEKALNQSHGKETGSFLGGLGGSILGVAAGRRLPKNTKGILQQTAGGLAGGLTGSAVGSAVGSNRDEKRTGFNHEDVMKPYDIATRMNNQQNFR